MVTCNNFDEQDITESLKAGGGTLLFYETENRQRTMYLGFDRSMAGLPFSLYFDIENYGDRPVRFPDRISDRAGLSARADRGLHRGLLRIRQSAADDSPGRGAQKALRIRGLFYPIYQ